MSRALIVVHGYIERQRALALVQKVPNGTRIEFKGAHRSIPQNDRMWAMLTDIASQLDWHGVKLPAQDWKLIFLDALRRELRIVPNLDGTGFVNLGRSSSDLSKQEMSDLIELMLAFGTEHGVTFLDPQSTSIVPDAAQERERV